jgi:hypothetical protein
MDSGTRRHDKKNKKKTKRNAATNSNGFNVLNTTDLNITSALHENSFEKALEEQRKKHKKLSDEHDASGNACNIPKAVIKGFVYDSSTDRYYKKNDASSSSNQLILDLKSRAKNESKLKLEPQSSNPNATSYLHLLSRREIKVGSSSQLHSKVLCSSMIFQPLHNEVSSRLCMDDQSDTDISYHPVFGLARTSSRCICIYEEPGAKIGDSINLNTFTRLGGSSDPQWRPSSSHSFNYKPALAILVYSPTFVQPVLLRRSDESAVGERSSWVVNKIGGVGSKDQGSVRKINWDSKGENLFLLCETGVWMSNIERNATVSSSSTNRNIADTSFDRSRMIISNSDAYDRNKCTQAVAICNSPNNESTVYVGFRNGELISQDLRSPSSTANPKIGSLSYCTDHIKCLNDGITLIAQDITGQISLYDSRMSGARSSEFLKLVDGAKDEVRKTRRFWLSPDESFIVAPANKSFQMNQRGNCDSAMLAAFSLRSPNSDGFCQKFNNRMNRNFISFTSLKVLHQKEVIESSVKIAGTSYSSSDWPNSSYSQEWSPYPGLYCVANIKQKNESNSQSTESDVIGSNIFKADHSGL